MRVFFYVQAKFSPQDAMIAFQHRLVLAKDKEDAYLRGQRLTDSTRFVQGLREGELINDYAIETNIREMEAVAMGGVG
jgi:hypothetical protein